MSADETVCRVLARAVKLAPTASLKDWIGADEKGVWRRTAAAQIARFEPSARVACLHPVEFEKHVAGLLVLLAADALARDLDRRDPPPELGIVERLPPDFLRHLPHL